MEKIFFGSQGSLTLVVTLSILVQVILAYTTPYSSWMSDMASKASIYNNHNLYTKTIFDVVWPGSHHAGQYDLTSTISSDSLGQIWNSDTSTYIASIRRAWSTRQEGNITYQLKGGSRFLDLRFEKVSSSSLYRTHEGLLGAESQSIFQQIKEFIQNSDEIVLVSLSDLLMSASELETLFQAIVTELGSFMLDSLEHPDLSTLTLTDIHDNGQLIFFSDRSGTTQDHYFYSSNEWLVNNTNIEYESYTTTRTHVLERLRFGWDADQLYQIFWTSPLPSDVSSLLSHYLSYRDYNLDAQQDLYSTIQAYTKIRFANAFLTDFTIGSGIVEQSILLNYNYMDCHDNNWGTGPIDCPAFSNLRQNYRYNDSTSCNATQKAACPRSCGLCPYAKGEPGSSCQEDSDCSSPYHHAYLNGKNGTCFITNQRQQYYIPEDSFCMSAVAYDTCKSFNQTDCDNAYNGTDCNQCTNNFDCSSSYCSSTFYICIEPTEISFRTPAPTPNNQRYTFIKSTKAKEFRDSIEILRPGDPDGEYSVTFGNLCTDQSSCLKLLNKNPYLTSLIGFVLIPFLLSIVLYIWYTLCCVPWCICDKCPKKCCCRACLGDPNESKLRKHGPMVSLFVALAFVIWGCAVGIEGNSSLHEDLFGETDSFQSTTLNMFSTFTDKFQGIEPIASFILDNVESILNMVDNVIQGNDIRNVTNEIVDVANNLTDTYGTDSIVLTLVIDYPYNLSKKIYYNVSCTDCTNIGDEIRELNSSLIRQANDALNYLSDALNETQLLSQARTTINDLVSNYYSSMHDLIVSVNNASSSTRKILKNVESYDSQRETGGYVFFTLPFSWLVIPIVGVVLSSKWFFKLNWCLAMYIGATVMLLFSLFAVTSVGWADFCVRLDDFEVNLADSQLGRLLVNLNDGGNFSFGLANYTNSSTYRMFDIVNACFTGESLIEKFKLDKGLDWNELRSNLTASLNVDVYKTFKSEQLQELETAIALLDASDYDAQIRAEIDADSKIAALNAESCPCIADPSVLIYDRPVLLDNRCVGDNGTCWENTQCGVTLACKGYYLQAYEAVSAEIQAPAELQDYIEELQAATKRLVKTYDKAIDTAEELGEDLQNVSCILGPLFNRFDGLLYDFANCGFIGQIYGDYKEIGCVTLFTDMYNISLGMMLIGFISILVVICSNCMDYVVDPIDKSDNDDWFEQPRKLYKSASRQLGMDDEDVQMATREISGERERPDRISVVEDNYIHDDDQGSVQDDGIPGEGRDTSE